MNHYRRTIWTVTLLALVVIAGVACAPITITTNARNAPTVPNPAPTSGTATPVTEMPFKFFLIHSVFSPDQQNADAVTVTRDGQDLTLLSNSSALTTSGSGSFDPNSKKADGSGEYLINNNTGAITAQGAWQVVSFVSWQQLPGGYPAELKVTAAPPPPGTVRSAGVLTVKVNLENLGEGEMVVHSKFLNTPDPNDTLLEGITLAVANSKFMEPAHDETAKTDEGSRFFVPTSAGSAGAGSAGAQTTGAQPVGAPPIGPQPVGAPPVGGNSKVTLCHMTGSASNPGVTITVSENAVDAHMAHGDHLGACDPIAGNGQPVNNGKPPETGKPGETGKPAPKK